MKLNLKFSNNVTFKKLNSLIFDYELECSDIHTYYYNYNINLNNAVPSISEFTIKSNNDIIIDV